VLAILLLHKMQSALALKPLALLRVINATTVQALIEFVILLIFILKKWRGLKLK